MPTTTWQGSKPCLRSESFGQPHFRCHTTKRDHFCPIQHFKKGKRNRPCISTFAATRPPPQEESAEATDQARESSTGGTHSGHGKGGEARLGEWSAGDGRDGSDASARQARGGGRQRTAEEDWWNAGRHAGVNKAGWKVRTNGHGPQGNGSSGEGEDEPSKVRRNWKTRDGPPAKGSGKPWRARAWQGVPQLLAAWEPLQDKLDAGAELEVWDCSTFGAQLLAWNEEYATWAGSTLSTALHRLATLRDRRGSFGPNCRWAFDVLLQRVGATSYWLKPRDMATMLWSIAKVAELEGVGLPGDPRKELQAKAEKGTIPTEDLEAWARPFRVHPQNLPSPEDRRKKAEGKGATGGGKGSKRSRWSPEARERQNSKTKERREARAARARRNGSTAPEGDGDRDAREPGRSSPATDGVTSPPRIGALSEPEQIRPGTRGRDGASDAQTSTEAHPEVVAAAGARESSAAEAEGSRGLAAEASPGTSVEAEQGTASPGTSAGPMAGVSASSESRLENAAHQSSQARQEPVAGEASESSLQPANGAGGSPREGRTGPPSEAGVSRGPLGSRAPAAPLQSGAPAPETAARNGSARLRSTDLAEGVARHQAAAVKAGKVMEGDGGAAQVQALRGPANSQAASSSIDRPQLPRAEQGQRTRRIPQASSNGSKPPVLDPPAAEGVTPPEEGVGPSGAGQQRSSSGRELPAVAESQHEVLLKPPPKRRPIAKPAVSSKPERRPDGLRSKVRLSSRIPPPRPPAELPPTLYAALDASAANWVRRTQDEQNAVSICLMLWSFATLGYNPLGGKFVEVAFQRLLPLCPDMDSTDVTKVFSSLAELKEPLPAELVEAMTERVATLTESGQLQTPAVPTLVQAGSRLRMERAQAHRLFKVLVTELFERDPQLLGRFFPGAMTRLLAGIARVRYPLPQNYVDRWAREALPRLSEYWPRDLRDIVVACRRLEVEPLGGEFLDRLSEFEPGLLDRGEFKSRKPVQLQEWTQWTEVPGGAGMEVEPLGSYSEGFE